MRTISSISSIDVRDRVLVLLSGGFDSVACMLALRDNGNPVLAVSFNYHDRPAQEAASLERIIQETGVRLISIELPGVRDARSLYPGLKGSRHEAWFPYRNMIFLSMACNLAAVYQCPVVAMGIRVWDTDAYDDASWSFLNDFARLAERSGLSGSAYPTCLLFPHIHNHTFAADCYRRHRATLELTWSCWRDKSEPCGLCSPCKTRQDFLMQLNQEMPDLGRGNNACGRISDRIRIPSLGRRG